MDTSVFSFNPTSNNLTSTTDGSGAFTQFGYGNANPYLPTTQQDPQGNTLTYGWSGRNLSAVQDTTPNGTGTTASYTYFPTDGTGGNGRGTLRTATDGNTHTTTYGYDQYGNLLTVTPPTPVGPETLQVDGVSRVISVTDGNNLTTLYTYDALDRVTNIQYNNGSGGSILYDFDNNGNQTSVVDNTGTTTFLYDADNRILKKTLPGGQVLSSSYDGVGNLLSYSDAGGKVSDTYTKVNLIETITEPHESKATTFTYSNNNQRHTQTYPNGVVTTWQYDKANRITSDVAATGNGTVLFNESDSYLTSSGNTPTEVLQTRTNNLEQDQTRYRYDTMNRLSDAPVFNSGNVEVDDYEYRFDKAGNWLSSAIHLNATPTTYLYNADNELTSKTQGSSTVNYTYDGTGNLLSFTGGPTSAYNAKNQTKSIGSDTYTYSGLGLSSQKDSSGTTYYTRCSCGLLIDERQPDGSKHYYITNSLGSIVGLTDQAGTQLVNTYELALQYAGTFRDLLHHLGVTESAGELHHFNLYILGVRN